MSLRSVALAGVILLTLSARPRDARARLGLLVDRIVALQETRADSETFGAIALHPDPSFFHEGEPYRHVVPYFSNLAVAALLEADPSPRSQLVAERWMAWFLEHRGEAGVPVEHWIGPGAVTTCPTAWTTRPTVERCDAIDATDSAASTFLLVVEAYVRTEGGAAFVHDRAEAIREVAHVLLALQGDDGLTLARADYPVKYLMDNVETVAGLRAMARVERSVLGGDGAAYDAAADRASAGLAALRDPTTGLLAWAKMPSGALEASNLDRWYADAVAQVWPLVFGTTAVADGYRIVDAAWNGRQRPHWTTHRDASGFAWPVLGVAALHAGDADSARRQADALWAAVETPSEPLTVSDLGWLLRTVAVLDDA